MYIVKENNMICVNIVKYKNYIPEKPQASWNIMVALRDILCKSNILYFL